MGSQSDDGAKSGQIGIRIDGETREIIEEQLDYGDSISEWVRSAIDLRIEDEGLCEENPQPAAMTAD